MHEAGAADGRVDFEGVKRLPRLRVPELDAAVESRDEDEVGGGYAAERGDRGADVREVLDELDGTARQPRPPSALGAPHRTVRGGLPRVA